MVSCSAGVAGLATATAGKKVFDYNRENYLYDRDMRMSLEYQVMENRINKADLFREDIQDVVELTKVKMDTYLIVNAVQLGFVVMALCEGRLAAGTPAWLVGAHVMAMAGAFTFYLMSVIFAMHATVASQSFQVRMLTQWVRLPVPSWAQIEGARNYASTFEKVESRQMFRVPFLTGKQEDLLNASKTRSGTAASTDLSAMRYETFTQEQVVFDELHDEDECAPAKKSAPADIHTGSVDPWGLEAPGSKIYELDATLQTDPRRLRHIQILREAMQYWQAYDGFARVAQSVGTNMLTRGMIYYVEGYVLISNHALMATFGAVILFTVVMWGLIRLDMSLTSIEFLVAMVLTAAAPVLALPCAVVWAKDTETWLIPYAMPIAYVFEALWCLFLIYACKVRTYKNNVILPRGFRSVLYIDVFGWIKDASVGVSTGNKLSTLTERPDELQAPEIIHGSGPAMQSARYVNGEPIPMRTEQLPGAARQQYMDSVTKESFATTTFVPREQDGTDDDNSTPEPSQGTRPWRVFCGATVLLAILWLIGSVGIALELWGLSNLEVIPLVLQPGKQLIVVNPDQDLRSKSSLLQSGHLVNTRWPHSNVWPVGLACDTSSSTIVVSTEFGLYTGDLSRKDGVQFERAPRCKHIQGEALQDVSLHCAPQNSSCHALVLHRHGSQLARCSLDPLGQSHAGGVNATLVEPSLMHIAEDGLAKDNTMSLTTSSQCSGQVHECAYASIGGGRVAELHRVSDGSNEWFPSRMLNFRSGGRSATPVGHMAVLHNRYLSALQRDGRHIHVLDLQNDAASAAEPLELPDHPDGKSWKSMCATSDHLLLLASGASPQLWRFPVPRLHTETASEAGARRDLSLLESQRSVSSKLRHRSHRWK